jgi:hypothetical protein
LDQKTAKRHCFGRASSALARNHAGSARPKQWHVCQSANWYRNDQADAKPIEPEQLRVLAAEVVATDRFPYLATMDVRITPNRVRDMQEWALDYGEVPLDEAAD